MTNEQLRQLAVRALSLDPEAVSDLIVAFQKRVMTGLRTFANRALWDVADTEEALSDVVRCLWSSLPKLADPAQVDRPWAYVEQIIHNRAVDVGIKLAKIHGHETFVDQWQDVGVGHDVDHVDGVCANEIVERWRQELEEDEEEAAEVFLEAAERDVPRRCVLAEHFPDDPAKQNTVEKRIYRGRQPNGFIAKLGDELTAEDDR